MSSNIRKGLLQFIFSGAYMKRWNDKLRPMELIEIDKQAHKMIVAWCLCRLAGQTMNAADRLALEHTVVEGGIFDYLFRLVVTDIKPAIFYKIKENPEQYQQLAAWGIGKVEPLLRPLDENFWQRFTQYVTEPKPQGLAADILAAAHQFASAWEFRLLQGLNEAFDDEMPEIDDIFIKQLNAFSHLKGMAEIIKGLPTPGRAGHWQNSFFAFC